jgi:hypothetical protein
MNDEIAEKVLIITAMAMELDSCDGSYAETSYDGDLSWFRVTCWRTALNDHNCDYNEVFQLRKCTPEDLEGAIKALEALK